MNMAGPTVVTLTIVAIRADEFFEADTESTVSSRMIRRSCHRIDSLSELS
jgi:hypothetical protein